MAVQSTNEINGVQNDDDDAGCSGVDTLRDNEGIDSDITDGTGANSDTCETSGTAPDIAAGVHENPVQPINQKYPVTYFGNKPRSFSSSWFTNNSWLKRIKTRLRSTMTEERLSDLAFLSIEREVVRELNYEDIINEFASTDKNRRILLV